jgi:SAM-dependent methyltransferase
MGLFDDAGAYDRFMGRFSEPLADRMLDVLDPRQGQRAVDVGCGPGAMTSRLAAALGPGAVAAVDPSASFVSAVRSRLPDVEVARASAERLPFEDDRFDVAVAQLVVHFMTDPVAGLTEMGRVTRRGGTVAACVWDNAGGGGPLSVFWAAVARIDPTASGERESAGSQEGHLAELASAAGLHDVESRTLSVQVPFATFEEWWAPYTLGVGPAGAYVRGCDDERREAVRAACEAALPPAPFELTASAWCVTARA